MKAVSNHFRLRRELCFVVELLEVATTTSTKVWTGRFDPHRRRRDDLFNRRKQDIALLAIDAYAKTISRRSQ